ncbi:isoleucine--tRNA ligase [Infirmifilum uzonense]|uniref:isoleucine--tRNA ligase n=1 Tax=Infirmifilum uzonense TaxID=1550241 RepID=UPI003C74F189
MGIVRALSQEFNPKKYEGEILNYWYENKIYDLIRGKARGKPKFYFLDGPPYASSGVPHVGTLWNKVLKDAVIRYYRALGYSVNDQPGYDCHGLPIEVQIERRLGFKSKKDIEDYGVDRFIEECKGFVKQNISSLNSYFKEFGVSMDWERPYTTMDARYIEGAWWLVKKAEEKRLLDYGLKVVHWCPRCETTLADYEVTEYTELEDPSIYVKFPVANEKNRYILIWTTTPWTLPANVAVMANPKLVYVWVEVRGDILLIAKDRLEAVLKEAGITEYKVLEEVKGVELEGLRYLHPLADEVDAQKGLADAHRVVLSEEFVSAQEGTGLVHSAPGHGEEDYIVGLRYSLPIVVLVDEKGRLTKEAGKYSGLNVRDANGVIIEDLKRKGYLFHSGVIRHRYPICWRCKTPLVLRGTKQWFIRVTHLKNRLLEEAEKVEWVPEWAGYSRFKNWLAGLRDWIISRQRYWGTPAPIWVCEKCGERVVVGSKKELEELAGGKLEIPDLHRPWIDKVTLRCPKCGGIMKRVPDVLDVWLDSGVAFYASLGYPQIREKFKELYPADLIIEGHDQIAGWFFSLLRSGIITFDEAPYRRVLMHGFALDEQGREMHKSLGNYVEPRQVLEYKYGSRDVFRWFVLRTTTWEDMKFSWKGLEEVYSDLNIFWNVYYFATLYMSLDKFDPEEYPVDALLDKLSIEDKWLLSRFETVAREVKNAFDTLNIHRAVKLIRDFVVEDLSHWYIRLIRPRVWIEEASYEKIAAYATLSYVLKRLLVIASPIIPFTTERIYLESFRYEEAPPSIHMLSWPEPRDDFLDPELEKKMSLAREIVEKALALRMKNGIKIRQPLPALYIFTSDPKITESVRMMDRIIASQVNVKKVEVRPAEELVSYKSVKVEPVYRLLGPTLREYTSLVIEEVNKKKEEVARSLAEKGSIDLEVAGRVFHLEKSMFEILESWREHYDGDTTTWGTIVLDTNISEKELAEGLARDTLRRIQFMRKQLSLSIDEYIETTIYIPGEFIELVKGYEDYLRTESRSKALFMVSHEEDVKGDLVADWEIGDIKIKIGIRRFKNQ